MEEGQLAPGVFVKDDVGTEGHWRGLLHMEIHNYPIEFKKYIYISFVMHFQDVIHGAQSHIEKSHA